MKLRRHPNDVHLALCVVIVTLAWGVIGLPWFFAPVLTGFGGLGWDSEVVMILSQFPCFLVDPAIFKGGAHDIFMCWFAAEAWARFILVNGSWLLGVAVLWLVHRRSLRSLVLRVDPRLIH